MAFTRRTLSIAAFVAGLVGAATNACGQSPAPPEAPAEGAPDVGPAAPDKVDVVPLAEDDQIARRLERILEATGWFRSPKVRVDEGVVFLNAVAETEERRQWAERLAGSTQDVVAVVNQIDVDQPDVFDFTPAQVQLKEMTRAAIRTFPMIAVAAMLIAAALLAARWTSRAADRVAKRRVGNPLLSGIIAKTVAVPVLIIGAYLALRVSGLTRLAATVLGGTGLVGIVAGFAFRDIAENFLASVLISMRRPFEQGDLVTVAGYQGFVQAVTTRGTQLMTLDGNHVQVPNATVYKSIIENASANPNIRQGFVVGVDYRDSASDAQDTVLEAVSSHEAVLTDPEPLVLVEEFAASKVNLQVWFWVNGRTHSVLKVRSAVLRRVKRALQSGGFTLPDEMREMIFPAGVPVHLVDNARSRRALSDDMQSEFPAKSNAEAPSKHHHGSPESDATATSAEGNLASECTTIANQAAQARRMGDQTDLLIPATSPREASSTQ